MGKGPLSVRPLAFHIYLFFSEAAEQISAKLAVNVPGRLKWNSLDHNS
jgi:hypothetical protein